MKVSITKKNQRNQLSCQRPDGSITFANLGPSLPYHDLAHFVGEMHFNIRNGFFGNVLSGYSIQELSDAQVICSLGPDSWRAEVIARAIGSLSSGACSTQQFEELVNAELRTMGISQIDHLDEEVAEMLKHTFQDLVNAFNNLADGQTLNLVLLMTAK